MRTAYISLFTKKNRYGVLVRVAPYQRIVEELKHRIAGGVLKPGDLLPSARAITREWGVAIATATKVLAALQQEGLTRAQPGVGTVVSQPQQKRGELSTAAIVASATRIADTEGLEALSMRRVATDLDVATMSLYRYVPSKDELVLQMIDSALGEAAFPEHAPGHWRPRMELAARLLWTVLLRHRWLAGAMTVARPQLLPNALTYADWVLTALDEAGLDTSERLYVHVSMFSFARGVALSLAEEAEAEQETGIDADEWMERQGPALSALVGERDSAVARLAAEGNPEFDLERLFEFGLARLLDGVEVWLATRSTPR
jgi:DNA-binding transcriptional regulator YhcF (GntR family)